MTQAAESASNMHSHIAELSPHEKLAQLLAGAPVLQMIHAGVELGVFAAIGDQVVEASTVAAVCKGLPDPMHRLLRGLSAIGLLDEYEGELFSLTPMGQLLRPDVVGSYEALARLNGSSWFGDSYRSLAYTVRRGQSGFAKNHGQQMFPWLAEHPAESKLFGQGMSTFSGAETGLILSHFDFSRVRHVVDVGGGHGLLLWRILEAVPEAQATLFDTEDTLRQGEGYLPEAIEARCERWAGDFFESVPEGGDLYLLKHILHDWDDDRALRILENVADAMPSGARLLVLEQGIADPGIPHPGKILDVLLMALLDGGRERSASEHAALMAQAGILFECDIPTPGPITLFLGQKP